MQTIFLTLTLEDLSRQAEAARRRSDVTGLANYRADVKIILQILEEIFGASKIVEYENPFVVKIDITQLGLSIQLSDKIKQFGKFGLGIGLSIDKSKKAATYSCVNEKGKLVIWSDYLITDELEKTEDDSFQISNLKLIDIENRLHACVNKKIQKEKQERELEHNRLNQARNKAYISVRNIMRQNVLQQIKVKDPDGYKIIIELMNELKSVLEEPLNKTWTFKGLPIHNIKKNKAVPVGTILKGKEKVDTANGPEWKSVRSGKVMSFKPTEEGGKRGYATSDSNS